MKTETMLQPSSPCGLRRAKSVKADFYEARLRRMKHFAALAAKYEAPLVSGMKRILDPSSSALQIPPRQAGFVDHFFAHQGH